MEAIREKASSTIQEKELTRVIGTYTRKVQGPVFICVAGLHGNEVAGVKALQLVIDELNRQNPEFSGRFYALAGNLHALHRQVRFVDEDMNRVWKKARIKDLVQRNPSLNGLNSEEREIINLYEVISPFFNLKDQPVYLLDLHTTSSESAPFVIMGDTIRNRHFARRIPVPHILGIEEHIEGTLSSFLNERGIVSINFEGGQHNNDASIRNHVSAIWLAMVGSGCMKQADVSGYTSHVQSLMQHTRQLPKLFEARYRYFIRPGQSFKMMEGYINFQKISRLEVLAQSDKDIIKAKENGRVFMPLYQDQGEDGFFIIKRISTFWLQVSVVLRKFRLDKLLPILPGISKYPDKKGTLKINTRVARFMPLQVFHLLGYKKISQIEDILIVTRRKYDLPEGEDNI